MEKTEYLIEKLNKLLLSVDDDKSSVSPTTPGGITGSLRDTLYINPELDVERLSKNELYLMHVLLHQLYSSKSRSLKKDDIIMLHEKVKNLISHSEFDELDRNGRRK